MKNSLSAILFAVAIVIASIVLGNAIINRNRSQGTINVTGLGESNFTSDLVVWEGNFSRESFDLKSAYADLEKDWKLVTDYLISKGIPAEKLIFNAVNTNPKYQQDYSWGGTFNTADRNKTASITMKLIFEVD